MKLSDDYDDQDDGGPYYWSEVEIVDHDKVDQTQKNPTLRTVGPRGPNPHGSARSVFFINSKNYEI
jgi:hypothetical protein